jgi:hypothetical protein
MDSLFVNIRKILRLTWRTMERCVLKAVCRHQGCGICQPDTTLGLFVPALAGELLLDHVFLVRFFELEGAARQSCRITPVTNFI